MKTAYLGLGSNLGNRLAFLRGGRDMLVNHAEIELVLMAGVREKLDLAEVPELVKGTAAALVVAGILSMGFMGFAGLGR